MGDARQGERMEVHEGTDGQFYFRRVAANNEPVAAGEGYTTKQGAIRGARRMAPNLPVYVQEATGWALLPAPEEPPERDDLDELNAEDQVNPG